MTNAQIQSLIVDYQSGMRDGDLRQKYRITRIQLHQILNENNIPRRSRNAVAQAKRNKHAGDTVECRVCNKRFQSLPQHLKMHGLTSAEYIERYNGAPIRSQSCSERLTKAHREKYDRHPELRERMREVGRKNITALNESGRGWRMPKGHHSEEHKQHMRELMTGRNVTWGNKIQKSHWAYSKHRDDVIQARLKTLQSDPERYKRWKEAISTGQSRRDPSTFKSNHRCGWYTSEKTSLQEYYRSSYERVRMTELDDDITVKFWTVHHNVRCNYQLNNQRHLYIPDFFIEYDDGCIVIEEVKGWISNQAMFDAKCSAAEAYCVANNMQYRVNFMKRK